jgi:hypothetical protein
MTPVGIEVLGVCGAAGGEGEGKGDAVDAHELEFSRPPAAPSTCGA